MSDRLPLPHHPGCTITAKGEVRNHLNVIYRVDEYGRVSLADEAGKRKKCYLGDLLAEAGFFASAQDAETFKLAEAVGHLRNELKEAQVALENARKANALLIGIRNDLTRQIARLRTDAPKPARKSGRRTASALKNGETYEQD
jgi:hypothetical protein